MNNRKFIPYKGWCVVNENGELEADPFMATKEGPLQIVNDIEKHMLSNKYADRHITYNLLDKEGKEILTKWVRKIKYNPLGFYLLEDNNEDDQIEKYRYIKTNEYWEKYNIVTNEGALLSENWFDRISSSITNGYFHVVRDQKQNLIDMSGRYLLKSDAEFVSYFNGLFAYCYRNGVLKKVFEGGAEVEYKQLKTTMLDGISIKGTDSVSIVRQNEEPRMMNLLLMNKHLLFKQWYDKVLFSGIRGLYFVINDGIAKLVDLGENPVADYEFELPCSSYFYNNQVVIRIEDEYAILNHTGKIEHREGFTSFLCPGRMGLWEVDMCTRGKYRRFFHGQGGEFIGYAHDFLLNRGAIGLFEKNKVWYCPDGENNMVKLFEWDPSEIDNTSN